MRDKLFLIRNILNTIFIVMAVGAMIGLVVCQDGKSMTICYGVAIAAVIIKIVEVILRIPNMTQKTVYEQRKHHKRRDAGVREAGPAEQ